MWIKGLTVWDMRSHDCHRNQRRRWSKHGADGLESSPDLFRPEATMCHYVHRLYCDHCVSTATTAARVNRRGTCSHDAGSGARVQREDHSIIQFMESWKQQFRSPSSPAARTPRCRNRKKRKGSPSIDWCIQSSCISISCWNIQLPQCLLPSFLVRWFNDSAALWYAAHQTHKTHTHSALSSFLSDAFSYPQSLMTHDYATSSSRRQRITDPDPSSNSESRYRILWNYFFFPLFCVTLALVALFVWTVHVLMAGWWFFCSLLSSSLYESFLLQIESKDR